VRIHTSLVAAAVAVVLAVPVVAGAATPKVHYAPTLIGSPVHPGTSAVSGSCTVTVIEGHPSNYRCPGSTVRQAGPGKCTLTVAAGRLWTYSCPSNSATSAVQGDSKGAIPASCTAIVESGFFWMFSCPRSAFGGTSTTVRAGTAKAGTVPVTPGRCGPPLTDRYLAGQLCAL
jgi:hypothetical protein